MNKTRQSADRRRSIPRWFRFFPIFVAAIACVLILFHTRIHMATGEYAVSLSWPVNILIILSALCGYFRVIDRDRFFQTIRETDPFNTVSPLKPGRYIAFLAAAMIVGFAATVVIYYRFIPGMLIYLIMQALLITAFSGMLHLSPGRFLKPPLRVVSLLSIASWAIIGPVVFITFVYGSPDALIVVPYVTALVIMALIATLGLAYTERSPGFRLMTFIGALSFVFSDTIIGYSVYKNPDTTLTFLIAPTYVLAIFLISHAPLALKPPTAHTNG